MLMHLNNLIAMYKNYANYDIEGILLFELSTLHHTLYTRYSIFNCTTLTTDMHPFYYNSGVEGILKVEGVGGLDYSETDILTSKKKKKIKLTDMVRLMSNFAHTKKPRPLPAGSDAYELLLTCYNTVITTYLLILNIVY